uniref:Uncharacterized protein n=1 Tax=Caenorhabditis japonica TaxID=281687 RepID=A0A8R1IAZ0_CAEJA
MNPLSQREQLRRMYSNGASSPVLTVDPYEQEFRYAPNTFCPQHSRQNSFRKSAPKYGQSSFGQQKIRSERVRIGDKGKSEDQLPTDGRTTPHQK